MDDSRPGYYAVIPADVRYDDSIPANAKLLYGEISSLIGAEGYCYASNQYFANIYGMTPENIARLLTKLENAGHIQRVIEKDNSGQIVSRKLFLKVSMPDGWGIDKKINTHLQKNQEGIDKKIKETNTSIIYTPQSPPEGGEPSGKKKKRSPQYKAQADVLPERFEKFWDFYRTHVPAGCNAGNRQKAIRAWDKLKPSGELVTQMASALAKQVKSQTWQSGIGVPHASTWLNNHGWEDDWGRNAEPKAITTIDSEEDPVWVN